MTQILLTFSGKILLVNEKCQYEILKIAEGKFIRFPQSFEQAFERAASYYIPIQNKILIKTVEERQNEFLYFSTGITFFIIDANLKLKKTKEEYFKGKYVEEVAFVN